ncbi:histidinol-phosphatase HisJ family protein [Sulfurimonas aquatica]|uniref:Histidinol-phosphatase n=1 Tax=Sulfurimonas aquatica TaxID=2672570 RepID=A0A975AYL5_9BACT|nr:histidinol-phosphatase [Sulfurimonas aquatica]QSZ40961.1 histidinol-phosphatase HisJ family protein [Sulfurimonas aquatica]
MIVDLHNHTPLCNHAQGTIDEYVEAAIKAKTAVFGFSDHAPMDFDPKYRMSFEQMKKYEQDVLSTKAKYQDKIEILLGYEVDYLKGHMDQRVLNADVDYLIGSVHFIEGWGFDNPEFIGKWHEQDIDEIWQKYFDTIEEMANSKLFDIVGHLDLIKVFKFMPKGDISQMAKNALLAIKKADMVLEINVAGFRKDVKESYPSLSLLKDAYNLDIPITFSSDAHKPEQVSLFNQEVVKMAKAVGYTECAYFNKRQKKFLRF